MVEKSDEKTEESTAGDSGEGDKPEATAIIEQQNTRIKELERERDERIMSEAKKALGGETEAGAEPVKPEKLTDSEVADKVMKGELDPLKEDGFI